VIDSQQADVLKMNDVKAVEIFTITVTPQNTALLLLLLLMTMMMRQLSSVEEKKYVYSSSWNLRATERRLPYGITPCYLPPDAGEPSHAGRYSIHLPRRDGRLS